MLGNIIAGCFGLAHQYLLQVAGEAQRRLDVGSLRALVPTGKQNYYSASAHRKVDPVTRAIIDSQFRDAFTNWFHISCVPSGQSLDTSQNSRACMNVAETIKPSRVYIGFTNFIHKYIVAAWLRFVNVFHPGSGKGIFFAVCLGKRLVGKPVPIVKNQ
jgi:hypothetical protein